MSYALDLASGPVEIAPGQPFTDKDDIQRAGNWIELATLAERQEAGVVTIVEPEAPEPGQQFASLALTRVGSLIRRVATYELIPPLSKDDLESYAVIARKRATEAGILFDGQPIPTDDTGRGLVASAFAKASREPATEKDWQVSSSPIAFVHLVNGQLIALGLAVDAMVQATFDTLKTVGEAIAAGTITTTGQIDDAFAAVQRVFTTPA